MGQFGGETWTAIMAYEPMDTRHVPNDVANDLRADEVETILATYEFFGCEGQMLGQIASDLAPASWLAAHGVRSWASRFRVFDWLAMMVQTADETLNRYEAYAGTQVMVHAFLDAKGDVDGFIENLRVNDYDCDRRWESIVL